MANGTANGNGSELRKIIGMSISITVALQTPIYFISKSQQDEIDYLKGEIVQRTDGRYRDTDAARDFALVEQKFENVRFRFQRNEEHIRECLEHVREQR